MNDTASVLAPIVHAQHNSTAVGTLHGPLTIFSGGYPAVSAAERPIEVGEGADPQTRRAFKEAFHRAESQAHLGRPTTQVIEDGLGFVQHFDGGDAGRAVICAIRGKPPVAVAGPVWDDLSTLPGATTTATGYPVVRTGTSPSSMIDYVPADATAVDLDGGSWGLGALLRTGHTGTARWQPHPRMTMDARLALQMPAAGQADLTVRAIATLPWFLGEGDLEISRQVRQRLEKLLPQAQISNAVTLLSRWRGAAITPPEWERPIGPNVHRSGTVARYDQVLWTPDRDAAVRTTARLLLPVGQGSGVIRVFVEFQVNLALWRSALESIPGSAVATDLRITANEVVELWMAAWDAATMVVPRALADDPLLVPLLAPPEVELQVKANDHLIVPPVELLRLVDVLDLSVFGTQEDDPRPEGAATIVAPIGLCRDDRRHWAGKTLTRLARAWTFADADPSDLDQVVR